MPKWTLKAVSQWSTCVWSRVDGGYNEEGRMGGASKNIVMDGDTMIDKTTGEVLDPEFDSTYWNDKF